MKQCTKCGVQKPLSDFYGDNARKDKKQSKCKPCHERVKVKSRVSAYGLTLDEYYNLFKNQNNCCAICNVLLQHKKHTHIDHCHETNTVRGLLCHNCNTAIGLFKDSTQILKSAILYLGKHAKKETE